MKKVILTSVCTLLLIIEFYPIEANSQNLQKDMSYKTTGNFHSYDDMSFELDQPEKEVFSESINIKFRLFNEGKVNLNVYDMEKRIVETLIDSEMAQGEYVVCFKALTEMLSGTYFYKLEMDGSEISQKIEFVKSKKFVKN